MAAVLQQLPLTELKPAADNLRRSLGDVDELAASIKSAGLLEPIVAVRENGHFKIVAGHRRYAGAKKAGLKTVDVIVRELTEQARLEAMLIENLQRADLSPLEEAAAYKRLVDEHGLTQRDLAKRVGRSQPHISKRLALLELPERVMEQVDAGGITIADAVELAKLADHSKLAEKVALKRPAWQSIQEGVAAELRELEKERLLAKREEELESKAIATVRVGNQWQLPKGVHRLKAKNHYDYHALLITPAEHGKHPCHALALYVDTAGKVQEFPVCTDRTQHPKTKTQQEADRGSSGTAETQRSRAKEQAEAQLLRDAERRRGAFIEALLARKTALPRPEAVQLIVRTMLSPDNQLDDLNVLERAAQLRRALPAPDVAQHDLGRIGLDPDDPGPLHILLEEQESDGDARKGLALCDASGMLSHIDRADGRGRATPKTSDLCADCLREHGQTISDEALEEALKEHLTTETSALKLGIALSLAGAENALGHRWTHWSNYTDYFAFLERHGYEPTPVEKRKLGENR